MKREPFEKIGGLKKGLSPLTTQRSLRSDARLSDIYARRIIESSLDMIVAVDPERRIVEFNRAAQETFGYNENEVLGKHVHMLYADKEEGLRVASEVMEKGSFVGEITNVRKGGEKFISLLSASIIRDEEGGFIGVVGNSRDITEEKRAQEALKESEEKFRVIVENIGDLVIKSDPEKRLVFVSPSYCEMFGKTEEELLGKPFMTLIHEDDRSAVAASLESLNKPPHTCYHEERALAKDGWRWLAWSNRGLLDEEGNLTGFIAVGRDITGKKEAEEALRESEERYHSLYDQAPDMYFTVSPGGTVTSVNRYGAEHLGYSKQELLGRPVSIVVHPEDRDDVRGQIEQLISERMTKSELRFRKVRKDGSTLWVHESLSLILDERGAPVELRIICRDITKQKLAEDRLMASLVEKEALLREIHHRVKNNLQIISSLLDLSSMRIHRRDPVHSLAEARARVHTMAQIHSQLYASDRFDRIEMGAHIRNLLNHLAVLYDAGGKMVDYMVESGEVHLPVDRAIPCALALNEVISNSFRHAFAGREGGRIEVSLDTRGPGRVIIAVKDDGAGIPDDIGLDRSRGLGLKLLATLVEGQLGGEVRIIRGQGTLIEIEFDR